MLEEYSVRSSDATIDIVYSEFNGRSNSICNNDSDLISITNETHYNELNNEPINESNNFHKKIIIFCNIFCLILGLIMIYLYIN